MEKEEWKIDRVESYYYHSGRNRNTYEEITFWYNSKTLERKETKRSVDAFDSDTYKLPDWARVITNRNRNLESRNFY